MPRGRKANDPAQHWVTATQQIVEFLGAAGKPETEVRQVLTEGLDAAIGMYYASIANAGESADGQGLPQTERAAGQPEPAASADRPS